MLLLHTKKHGTSYSIIYLWVHCFHVGEIRHYLPATSSVQADSIELDAAEILRGLDPSAAPYSNAYLSGHAIIVEDMCSDGYMK